MEKSFEKALSFFEEKIKDDYKIWKENFSNNSFRL